MSQENLTAVPNETQATEDVKHDVSTLQKLLKTHPEVFKCSSKFSCLSKTQTSIKLLGLGYF